MTHPAEHLARRVAEEAHAGQVDKAGQSYIGHVERVVARLTDPLDRAVAWLHDVVEDTEWTAEGLMARVTDLPADVPDSVIGEWSRVVLDVKRLTHVPHESRAYYYRRVRTSDRAVRVKLADIADNTDPERLALVERVMNERGEDGTATKVRLEGKYAKALRALGVSAVPAPEEEK